MPSRASLGIIALGLVVSTPAVALANRNPNARNDVYPARPNTPLNVAAPGILANDVDPDGDPVVAISITDSVDHGTLAAFANGSFTYTSDPGFTGKDAFEYTVSDGQGGTDTAKVTIKVENKRPNARNDLYPMRSNATLDVAAPGFLTNDVDPDGDPVVATSIQDSVDHGTLAAFANGSFIYTPDPGFIGRDTFEYGVSDGHSGTDTAKVTIKVANRRPNARNEKYTMNANTTLNVAAPGFLTNDVDPDGDPIVATTISDGVDHGTLAAFANGSFIYTPDPGFVGKDAFEYGVSDGHGGTDTAKVIIRVND